MYKEITRNIISEKEKEMIINNALLYFFYALDIMDDEYFDIFSEMRKNRV